MNTFSEKEESAQSLCTSCGLCCDGSIFDHVVIKPEDDVVLLTGSGFSLSKRRDNLSFGQPCPHFQSHGCDVYFSGRPITCIQFRCKILKRLDNGKITIQQCMEIIEKTRQHAAELRRQIQTACPANIMSISEMFDIWKNQQEAPDQAVLLNFAAFKFRLSRDFGKTIKSGGEWC